MSEPMPFRVVVAEDERSARERLCRILARMPGVEIVALCETGREAAAAIQTEGADLAILDVQMPGLDAFGVIETVGADRMPQVVFVTAYDRFAVRAFEEQAVDFVLKPFDDERVEEAVRRAAARIERDRLADIALHLRLLLQAREQYLRGVADRADPLPFLSRIAVREGESTRLLAASDIDWIEADGKQARVHTGRESHRVRMSLQEIEARLDPRDFVRIHKSTIVRIARIRELRPKLRGDYVVTLHDGTAFRLSRARRAELESRLGQSL